MWFGVSKRDYMTRKARRAAKKAAATRRARQTQAILARHYAKRKRELGQGHRGKLLLHNVTKNTWHEIHPDGTVTDSVGLQPVSVAEKAAITAAMLNKDNAHKPIGPVIDNALKSIGSSSRFSQLRLATREMPI